MTELIPTVAVIVPWLAFAGALATALARSAARADRVNVVAAVVTGTVALALAAMILARGGEEPLRGGWYLIDGASGVFLAVIAIVGLSSALVSPTFLRTSGRGWIGAAQARHWYYAALYVFWGVLLAVPLVGNLGVAWLIVDATTAASALLVAYSGRRDALEAAWKYLVLTTLGLSVALLGIVVLAIEQSRLGHTGLRALDLHTLAAAAPLLPHDTTVLAFVLLIAGLATKVGWAPVHNWLPDAHSEAPAPVSALLSAALLPTVVLIAWRVKSALGVAVGASTASGLLIAFGILSIVVAVPFLWRPLPWKRLLAYSSLEHMGVLALGIGFGTRLAIAGVVLHVAGHALAKALGFYAALPLARVDSKSASRPPSEVAAKSPVTASAMAVSLVTLSGLPPSPLFVSELLILYGGVRGGHTAIVAVAAFGLALGFLGLLHALLEGVFGEAGSSRGRRRHGGERPVAVLTVVYVAALGLLTVAGLVLVDSPLVARLAGGGG